MIMFYVSMAMAGIIPIAILHTIGEKLYHMKWPVIAIYVISCGIGVPIAILLTVILGAMV